MILTNQAYIPPSFCILQKMFWSLGIFRDNVFHVEIKYKTILQSVDLFFTEHSILHESTLKLVIGINKMQVDGLGGVVISWMGLSYWNFDHLKIKRNGENGYAGKDSELRGAAHEWFLVL